LYSLEGLGVPRAHVVGHSTGAVVAAQLALDQPAVVQTLVLLEPFVLSVQSGEAVLQQARPAFEAYGNGDREGAWAIFLSAASGLDWTACRAVLEDRIPGVVAQAVKDAGTLFGAELPAMATWAFGPERAAAIGCPVLSVRGTDTLPLFVEVAALLRSSLPDVEECVIDGVGHLLHIQRPEPVARAMGAFLRNHPRARD
jgi:pimeloyl-ACP methyl ester carboxylesterase